MVTLDEIQTKVSEAQEEMKKRNYDAVRQRIWPEIQDALDHWPALKSTRERKKMEALIISALDEQTLESAKSETINVVKLQIEAEKDLSPVPPRNVARLPY